jgi:hypothetical protein
MAKTDLSRIDADLAERAKNIQKQISAPESRRITVDQKTGELMGPGGLSMGDEVRIIAIDFCTTKRYYDQPYDSNNPNPPACMAIGDVIADMVPEEGVPAPQSEFCRDCWANKWESDAKQKGKACKETRDLVVVLVDELEDPDYEPEMYVVSCSPTALKSFDAAAVKVHQLFNGPPIKAIMTMKSKSVENYYNLSFGGIDANTYLERVYPLLSEAPDMLSRMPDFSTYVPPKRLPPDDVRNSK